MLPVLVLFAVSLIASTHARISPRIEEPLCTVIKQGNDFVARLDAWGDDSIRIRIALDNIQAVPEVQAMLPDPPAQSMKQSVKPCSYIADSLTNGNLKLNLNDDGTFQAIRVSDQSVLVDSQMPDFNALNTWDTDHWAYNDPSIYASKYSLFNISVTYKHSKGLIYGLGEHKTGQMRYGTDQAPYTHLFEDSQVYSKSSGGDVSIPFYMSQAGFGVLMNQAGYGSISIDQQGATWTFNSTHQFDMWITTASTGQHEATPFPSISRHYADVVGHPNPLPHFASGFWQSKDRYRNQSEILSITGEFNRLQIPVEVFVIDWQHWQYLGDWNFYDLKNCWQDVDGMVKTLTSYGMHTMISAWPRLDRRSSHWKEFESNGYLTYNATGGVIVNPTDSTIVYDPFNPAARAALWSALVNGYVQHGIHLFWLDAAEPEGSAPGEQWWSGKNDREVGMAWPVQHHKMIFEGSISSGIPESEIIMLTRSVWIGSQLYNGFLWSGDISSDWQSFGVQVRLAPNVALSGIHWWSTDIGGYFNGQYESDDFQEMLVRWFQWGAFMPIFRTHGHRQPSEENEICGGGGGPNELWTYTHQDIITGVIMQREKMRDYVEHHLNIASQTGIPIVQPMWYNFTDDECWSLQSEDQYMFGPDYLVAPVLAAKATSRSVYLPKLPSNEQWVHYFSNKAYTGGQRVDIPVTLADFPLFVRSAKQQAKEAHE